jgi:oligo-1,6-glucosidase
MLATLLLTLRGTPSIYQGDEIGMTNCFFENMDEFNDIQVKNAYNSLIINKKGDETTFLKACNVIARDHARTPMQWNATKNGGFTEGDKTWLKVNPNYTTINVRQSENDSNSIYQYYRTLIHLRKENTVLAYGTYKDRTLASDDETLWVFSRTFNKAKCLVLCNFTNQEQSIEAYHVDKKSTLLLSNYANTLPLSRFLAPYEVRLLAL